MPKKKQPLPIKYVVRSVQYRKVENPFRKKTIITTKKKEKDGIVYTRVIRKGTIQISSKVKIVDLEDKIEKFQKRQFQEFKRSNKQSITGSVQKFRGKIKSGKTGAIIGKISKPARLFSVKKTDKMLPKTFHDNMIEMLDTLKAERIESETEIFRNLPRREKQKIRKQITLQRKKRKEVT